MDLQLFNAVSHVTLRSLIVSEMNFEICHRIRKKGIDHVRAWKWQKCYFSSHFQPIKTALYAYWSIKSPFWHQSWTEWHWIDLQLAGFIDTRFVTCLLFWHLKITKILIFQPIPANKIAVKPNEYFWHLSHYENRIQDTQIDLQLTGFVVWVTGTYHYNLLCEKNDEKIWVLEKMTLK